jgi:hypothetical protein
LGSKLEQPLPVPTVELTPQTVSDQPRAFAAGMSEVPPTDMT